VCAERESRLLICVWNGLNRADLDSCACTVECNAMLIELLVLMVESGVFRRRCEHLRLALSPARLQTMFQLIARSRSSSLTNVASRNARESERHESASSGAIVALGAVVLAAHASVASVRSQREQSSSSTVSSSPVTSDVLGQCLELLTHYAPPSSATSPTRSNVSVLAQESERNERQRHSSERHVRVWAQAWCGSASLAHALAADHGSTRAAFARHAAELLLPLASGFRALVRHYHGGHVPVPAAIKMAMLRYKALLELVASEQAPLDTVVGGARKSATVTEQLDHDSDDDEEDEEDEEDEDKEDEEEEDREENQEDEADSAVSDYGESESESE